jgi:hypothetical protein
MPSLAGVALGADGALAVALGAGSRTGAAAFSPHPQARDTNAKMQRNRTAHEIVACAIDRAQIRGRVAAGGSVPYVLALGPRARVLFAAGWVALQAGLVLTASCRPDGIFGFRMFPEASTLEFELTRVVGGVAIPAPGGEWSARDAAGQLRHFSWRARVTDPVLSSPGTSVFASYGADAQLARLQRALDDVAVHEPEDAETERFVARVAVWRNGRGPSAVVLESAHRELKP